MAATGCPNAAQTIALPNPAYGRIEYAAVAMTMQMFCALWSSAATSFVAGEFIDGRKWCGTPLEGYLLDAFSRSIDSWSVRPTLFHAAVWSSTADFTWIGDLYSTRLVTAILVPAAAPRRIDSIIVFMLIVYGTSLLRFPDLPADGRRRQRFFTIWIILTHSGDFGNRQETE